MSGVDEYKKYLNGIIQKCDKIIVDYEKRHNKGKMGEWDTKQLVNTWKRYRAETQKLLDKETQHPQEFADDASLYARRMSFNIH